jgi:hypothetical protein
VLKREKERKEEKEGDEQATSKGGQSVSETDQSQKCKRIPKRCTKIETHTSAHL